MQVKPLSGISVVAFAAAACTTAHATDWLQFGYDTAHSGFNRAETGYSTKGNRVAYHYALPSAAGSADSAPIYLGGVTTAQGVKNLLFVATQNGTLVALDADSPTLNVIWSKTTSGAGGVDTGSPAIDPGLQHVYAYGIDGKVHKYQVGDGQEFGVDIPDPNWPEWSTIKPEVEKGAAGLSIAMAQSGDTYLYSVTDGYIGDQNDYQGHLTAINLATGTQKVFNSECSDRTIHFCNTKTPRSQPCDLANACTPHQNGIWGRPGAVYDAPTDRVFISTGNGPFAINAGSDTYNWGDSILALNPDGSGGPTIGMPVDSYTPTTFQNLQNTDADLGSESIAIVPPPPGTAAQYLNVAVQTGKDGCVRLVNLADLSGHGGPAHTGGELDAQDLPGGSSNCAAGGDGPEIKPQPAVWVNPVDSSSWIFVTSYGNGSVAYKISLTAGKPLLALQWPPGGTTTAPSGTSPVVANATMYYMSGNHLVALDAVTGTSVSAGSAWATTSFSSQHWQSPIIVNGRVYLVNGATPAQLWVFQLDGAFKSSFE